MTRDARLRAPKTVSCPPSWPAAAGMFGEFNHLLEGGHLPVLVDRLRTDPWAAAQGGHTVSTYRGARLRESARLRANGRLSLARGAPC